MALGSMTLSQEEELRLIMRIAARHPLLRASLGGTTGPRTVPVRSASLCQGAWDNIGPLHRFVAAANRDGSRSVLFGCFTTRVARPRCGGGGRRAREYQSYPRRVSGECPASLPRLSPASMVGLAHATEAPRASRARGILGWLGCRLGDSSARRIRNPGVARNILELQ